MRKRAFFVLHEQTRLAAARREILAQTDASTKRQHSAVRFVAASERK